jgi:hypothetical protein
VFFSWCEDLRFGSFSALSLFCFDPPLTPQLKNWLANWRKPAGNQPENPMDELSSTGVIVFLFVGCLVALIGSLFLFLWDINQSLLDLKLDLEDVLG